MLYYLSILFLLFIIYSILGWIIEVIAVSIKSKQLVNRGFLIGPYCPIYGSGGVMMVLLLQKYVEDPLVVFILAMVICSLLEYITSYIMELVFKARWWDYSDKKFNLNGRICLSNMIAFGVLGVMLIYFVNPIVTSKLYSLQYNHIYIITAILVIILTIDMSISFRIINKVKQFAFEAKKDNTLEITARVKELLRQNGILSNRLIKAYPNLVSTIKSKSEEILQRKQAFINNVKRKIELKEDRIKQEIKRFKIKM